MDELLDKLREFLEIQIKTYQKTNFIEIKFGKCVGDGIFKTMYQDNNEIAFTNLIKPFRNYKLSYSQGKYYCIHNLVLKTFNNKYNQIQKIDNLESEILQTSKYDLQINNVNKENIEEFPIRKEYYLEEVYEEVNIHITQDSNEQLLIFQKNGDHHLLKLELKLELNLPYTYLDDLMMDIRKALQILESSNFLIT